MLSYVKNEGANLGATMMGLKVVMNCERFILKEPFQCSYFRHAMSKVCQYGTKSDKGCVGMHVIAIKFAQVDFQKFITW
jgi:hypothetical protein